MFFILLYFVQSLSAVCETSRTTLMLYKFDKHMRNYGKQNFQIFLIGLILSTCFNVGVNNNCPLAIAFGPFHFQHWLSDFIYHDVALHLYFLLVFCQP